MNTIYVICNRRNRIIGITNAFTSKAIADYYAEYLNDELGYRCHVEEINNLPFVGRYVYYIQIYRGFDYDYDFSKMYDDIVQSGVYSSIALAKTSPHWQYYSKVANLNPNDHIIELDHICSKEDGREWFYGDVMEDNFNMQLKKIKVCKTTNINEFRTNKFYT